MAIIGSGSIGRRLWYYGPTGWMAMPTGGGVDQYVKSINIWDKKKKRWFQVCWAGGLPTAGHPGTIARLSTKIHNGSVQWTAYTSSENPLYSGTTARIDGSRTWSDAGIGTEGTFRQTWLPLTFVKPRVDPTWRIVSLLGDFPVFPMLQDTGTGGWWFFPRGGRSTQWVKQYLHDGSVEVVFNGAESLTRVSTYDQGNPGRPRNTEELCRYEKTILNPDPAMNGDPGLNLADEVHLTSSMLDFQVIRRRIKEHYPYCDQYYNGVYDDFSLATLKRVYVTANIFCTVTIISKQPPAAYLSGVRLRIYHDAQDNPASLGIIDPEMYIIYGDGSYVSRAPASVDPSGTWLFEHTEVLPLTVSENHGDSYSAGYSLDLRGKTFTFEDFGQDNLTFYADVAGVPNAAGDDRLVVSVLFTFSATDINLHYVEAGLSDTPANTHNPYSTTRDVA